MNATLSAKGQIVIPQAIRTELKLRSGDDFQVLSSRSGDILLKPVRRQGHQNLADALMALRGLKLSDRSETIRDLPL